MAITPDQTSDVEHVTDRVSNRLGGATALDAVRARVRRQFAAFHDVAVHQFVPIFVERRVRAELRP
jgi:hypothetical protein